jgi:hypothetical protein
MNKALIAKQYWRICNHPNLLLTKTLKSKYCPNEDIHTHKPKPHSSWIWKSIIGSNNPTLTQGKWRVGDGTTIPINHPFWYQSKPNAPTHILNHTHTVADLINADSASWKTSIINQLYDPDISQQILSNPLPKIATQSIPDKIIWPHSTTGEYRVKKAYELLHANISLPNNVHQQKWKHLWKIPIPHKILTFTWKFLRNALPLKTELCRRGINCDPVCPLCQTATETINHLFLQCHFTRKVWLGVDINTRALIQNHITIQTWI